MLHTMFWLVMGICAGGLVMGLIVSTAYEARLHDWRSVGPDDDEDDGNGYEDSGDTHKPPKPTSKGIDLTDRPFRLDRDDYVSWTEAAQMHAADVERRVSRN